MSEQVIVALIAAGSGVGGTLIGYLSGANKTKIKVDKNEERINKLELKPCPCDTVAELRETVKKQGEELITGSKLFVEIKKDLEYIKKAVDKHGK
ncbi:MAG: hypothetical protein GX800_12250 [Clostridiaceae bacterium]|jgi:hypothetical protein|nr:hypothetical protein [Clostridiaceae bacterium]